MIRYVHEVPVMTLYCTNHKQNHPVYIVFNVYTILRMETNPYNSSIFEHIRILFVVNFAYEKIYIRR